MSRSGPNISDDQRSTKKLTLRLAPGTVEEIRTRADEEGCSMAAVVTKGIEAIRRPEPEAESKVTSVPARRKVRPSSSP